MEAIEVTAKIDESGKVYPLHFRWQGQNYPVLSTGRQWADPDGRHVLVMIPGERVFELLLHAADGIWYLQPPPEGPAFI